MERRDDDGCLVGHADGNPESCREDLAGESPVSVGTRAPSSRPAAKGEILTAEAGCQKRASQRELISEERVREPQHEVKPAASSDSQSEGRAAHVTGKATSTTGDLEHVVGLGGVQGAARVQGSPRNTRDPSAQPLSRQGKTRRGCEDAERDVRKYLARLGLELHPDKTRRVELYDGKQGFDFLGCHFRKRLSGKIWERERKRVYFLHRWPSRRAMNGIRQRVREQTPRGRCHADLREVIADLNPILRGWGAYFRTGNASDCFNQIDAYVHARLHGLHVKRAGRNLGARKAATWTREYFWNHGLHRLLGTVTYPETAQYPCTESPPTSRVREIREHGFYGGRMETRATRERK